MTRSSSRTGGGPMLVTTNGGSRSALMAGRGGANTTGDSDPSFLLTRGYAARLLPPAQPGGGLQALSADEIDKDLRHMQAYHHAVLQYQQQFYWQTNQGDPSVLPLPPASSAAVTSPSPRRHAAVPPSLPVRIDPDEEKRQTLLQQKIQKAETLREQAEQTYVAHLAHYVQTGQDLRQSLQTAERNINFLSQLTQARAQTVALLRARLHMTRDVLHSLTARGALLEQVLATAAASGAGGLDGGGSGSQQSSVLLHTRTPAIPEDDEMLLVWNQLEEDFKKAVVACRQVSMQSLSESSDKSGGSARSSSKKEKDNVLVPWSATQRPATPYGVPLMLSALSDAPEKSLAWNCDGMFGSHPTSMSWREAHIPAETVSKEELASLQEEVDFLTRELQDERATSQNLCGQIGTVRSQQDEWVAMMALVRQETEAVLHRHHVVMESPGAMEAAQRLYQEEQQTQAEEAEEQRQMAAEMGITEPAEGADAKDEAAAAEGEEDAAGGEDEERASGVPAVEAAAVDLANDGDDEDSNNDEEEEEAEDNEAATGSTRSDNWASGSKRSSSADDDGSPTGRSKRRRV